MAGYIGQAPANKFLTLDKQTFTTSATDTYSLDRSVSSANEIELFLNNVRQEPIEAYTVNGSTLTLASAITSSDTMYCIYQGKAIGTVSPATNSVSNDMLAGSIPNSKLANSSITLNGSDVSLGGSASIGGGITMAQQWRLTTDFSINSDSPTVIASNWETIDTDDGGSIGSSMSESSGIFTYPSTGIYNVTFVVQLVSPNTSLKFAGGQIETTTNNSSYGTAAANYNAIYFHADGFGVSTMNFMHDVADVSNDKIRFKAEQYNSSGISTSVKGNSTWNYTYVTFVRLGDT